MSMGDRPSGDGWSRNGASLLCREVMVAFGREIVVSAVTFGVEPGQLAAIIGPHGAGKSTLLRAIVGLVPLTGGDIEVDRQPARQMLRDIAYVSRHVRIDWSLPVSVATVVAMGRYPHVGWFGRLGAEDRRMTDLALEIMELTRIRNLLVGELSVGQQQRVLLARGLAQEPKILLLDEPLTGIDLSSRATILNVLNDQHQVGRTILLATSDLAYAKHCDLVVLLDREVIRVGIPDEVFEAGVLSEAFGDRLIVLRGRH